MELADGRRALCVFSFEEEARLFLRLAACGGWRARASGIGDLVSVLSGPCGEVELVALDPLPQGEAELVNRLLCVDRERFVGFLLRKGSGIRGVDDAHRTHAGSEAPRGAVPVVVDRVASGGAYGVGKTGRA